MNLDYEDTIEVNNLRFCKADKDCKIIIADSEGELYAFIQVVDIGTQGSSRYLKRYWGKYSHSKEYESIERIMCRGGKWPELLEPLPEQEF